MIIDTTTTYNLNSIFILAFISYTLYLSIRSVKVYARFFIHKIASITANCGTDDTMWNYSIRR
jgi:hypothetical protein